MRWHVLLFPVLLVAALYCGLFVRPVQAAVFIESFPVSGVVVRINPDRSVRLNNGITYQPARPELSKGLVVNQVVTLRCIKLPDGGYQFFEYAPGRNSLKKIAPPEDPHGSHMRPM
ncbi:MAG: hypothetical protein ACOX5Z_12435 [Desulfobulbus sp.]|jgi:hypothetical protein